MLDDEKDDPGDRHLAGHSENDDLRFRGDMHASHINAAGVFCNIV